MSIPATPEERVASYLGDISSDLCTLKDHFVLDEPTWLDRCAWAAMQGRLASAASNDYNSPEGQRILAKTSYDRAQAMLAEKRRREGAP